MNGVQMDMASLSLALAEPAATPAGNRGQPSFDEHLRDARRPGPEAPRKVDPPKSDEGRSPQADAHGHSPAAETSPPAENMPPEEASQDDATENPAVEPEPPADEPPPEESVLLDCPVPAMPESWQIMAAPKSMESHDAVSLALAPAATTTATTLPTEETAPTQTMGVAANMPQAHTEVAGIISTQVSTKQPAQGKGSKNTSIAETQPVADQAVQSIDPAAVEFVADVEETSSPRGESSTRGSGVITAAGPPVATTFDQTATPTATAAVAEGLPVSSAPDSPAASADGQPDLTNTANVERPDTPTAPMTPPDNAANRAPGFTLPVRTPSRGDEATLTEADQARFVQRVARAFETAGEGGQIRLRLSPPELGSLRMEVSVQNGVLTAHVEAETPQARMLLLDNLPALRDRLQEQNIKVERFDVDLMNQQSPGGRPQEQRERQRQGDEQPGHTRRDPQHATEAQEARPAAARRFSGGDQLNVVI